MKTCTYVLTTITRNFTFNLHSGLCFTHTHTHGDYSFLFPEVFNPNVYLFTRHSYQLYHLSLSGVLYIHPIFMYLYIYIQPMFTYLYSHLFVCTYGYIHMCIRRYMLKSITAEIQTQKNSNVSRITSYLIINLFV